MKLLVVGHSLIIDANRKLWSTFARDNGAQVELIAPVRWSSNLSRKLDFQENASTDGSLHRVHKLRTIFQGRGSVFFFSPVGTFKVLNAKKFDAVYLNQETWAVSTLVFILLKLLSRNRSTRLYLGVAQNLKKPQFKFLHPYERLVSRFVHCFLYCSSDVMEVLRWKGIRTPCAYFPLPFDDETYTQTPPREPNATFRLGYLGRISEEKGIGILLEACEILSKKSFDFALVIGGTGPLTNEVQKSAFVTYLGLIPHNEAHHFYEKIDCFLLPSQTRPHWKEQFGRVIVEAFGAGKPVIGSSSGSIPEVLGKLGWNWSFEESSAPALAQKILELKEFLETPDGRLELSKAIEKNQRLFSQTTVARDLGRILEQ